MESTSSIAQGSFLFLPEGFSLSKFKNRKRKLEGTYENKWEIAFHKVWGAIHKEIKTINEQLFSKVLEDLIHHMKEIHNTITLNGGVIPCEILLTGSNLSDHKLLFSTFIQDSKKNITPYVTSLWSWNCGNIKSTIQNLVSQIIGIKRCKRKIEDGKKITEEEEDEDIEDDNDGDGDIDNELMDVDEHSSSKNEKKYSLNNCFQMNQYNFSTLSSWYECQCKPDGKRKPVIIIIPDFESFAPKVLGDLILLLSAYSSAIPFILVFGVATTPVAVYQNLSRKVLSQLVIQLFKSEPSPSLLNKVVENVLFSERCPFRLGNKCMTFLTDIFLFHSFSVHGFIQGYKYCLMEHFFKRNHFSLCCPWDNVTDEANELTEEELENIRKLPSFKKLVEDSPKDERKSLLLNSDFTRTISAKMMKDLIEYTRTFHIALKILHIITNDLPKNPLGRYLREYYCKSVSVCVYESEEYKECMKLLSLQSQKELFTKINEVINFLNMVMDKTEKFRSVSVKLTELVDSLQKGDSEDAAKELAYANNFEDLRNSFLDCIHGDIVKEFLKPPIDLPLHEVVYFDNLSAVRRRISGSPRGAIHLALSDPQGYLNCNCCSLPSSSEQILSVFPDLSIAYKTHLECNKMINMYDWLQSFAAIVKQDDSENDGEIDKELQYPLIKTM
ncbi:UNVERIFIED_CONTAM: hypothetical protein PYX00_002616 [Menopon gallinae]|uniref:Origin recognition complex subunit 3 n=1 Tax=Menopon gallinae TaxID=328185 RepID=A0AAW2HX81_9NEOP